MEYYLTRPKVLEVLEYDGTNNYQACMFVGPDNWSVYNEVGEIVILGKVMMPGMVIIKDRHGKVSVITREELDRYYERVDIECMDIRDYTNDSVSDWLKNLQDIIESE